MNSGMPIDVLLVIAIAVLFLGAAFSDHRRKIRELREDR